MAGEWAKRFAIDLEALPLLSIQRNWRYAQAFVRKTERVDNWE